MTLSQLQLIEALGRVLHRYDTEILPAQEQKWASAAHRARAIDLANAERRAVADAIEVLTPTGTR